MSKEERQAFFYLENLIIKSKMECIAAIPRTQVYNDSELRVKIQSYDSKVSQMKNNINDFKYILEMMTLSIETFRKQMDVLIPLENKITTYINLFDILIDKLNEETKNKIFNSSDWIRLKNLQKLNEERNENIAKVDKAIDKWIEKYPIDEVIKNDNLP